MKDSPFEGVDETKEERKARRQREKEAARQAKAETKQAKAAAKAEKAAGKSGRKEAKAQRKHVEEMRLEEKLARYRQLRASVRNRRVAYGLFIVLAIATFLATVWDIVYNESAFKWYLLPTYAVLFLLGVLLLFSRKRHLEEVAELAAMHRTYLECESCRSVFQFGELRFGDRKRVGFTCPVCAEESALPGPGAQPVERPLPDSRVTEATYACGSCSEQIVVGTFGALPRESRFRACPRCGVPGQVALV